MNRLSASDLEALGNFVGDLNQTVSTYKVGLAWDGSAPRVLVDGDDVGVYLSGNAEDGYSVSTSEYA